jgi:hypothetical protein
MQVLFVAGFGPIVRDQAGAAALYLDTLGLALEREEGGYLHTERLPGVKTFALWPLAQAAQSCFGSDHWPESLPAPFVCRLLFRLQAIKQQGSQNVWEFFPPLDNHLVAEQLERE